MAIDRLALDIPQMVLVAGLPAFVYIETHGGTAIGGSDDHAGIDIGRTFTETPAAATPSEFLAHIR
ncbi:MAG: hypothetical protein ACXVS6_23605, partial [Solirubrobacteraceae bacterium]